jgi:hypothetical protein
LLFVLFEIIFLIDFFMISHFFPDFILILFIVIFFYFEIFFTLCYFSVSSFNIKLIRNWSAWLRSDLRFHELYVLNVNLGLKGSPEFVLFLFTCFLYDFYWFLKWPWLS